MTDWIVAYSDNSVATITAPDMFSALSLAYGNPPKNLSVVSVIRQSDPNPVLESATAKLVDLGLTPDEAQAVSGNQ